MRELVEFIARSRTETERLELLDQFRSVLKSNGDELEAGAKYIERRRSVLSLILSEIKGVGSGSEKG